LIYNKKQDRFKLEEKFVRENKHELILEGRFNNKKRKICRLDFRKGLNT